MKFAWKTSTFVFIQEWSTATSLGLAAAMIVGCGLSVFYEYVRRLTSLRARQRTEKTGNRIAFLLCQATLFMTSVLASNLLMLVLMTYNLWIFISIVIGAGCGYFLIHPVFDHRPSQQNNHHKITTTISTKASTVDSHSPQHHPLLANNTSRTNTNAVTTDEEDFIKGQKNVTDNSVLLEKGVERSEDSNSCIEPQNGSLIYEDDIGVLFDSSPFKQSRESPIPSRK